jgi:quinol monooxygenase YgiN
VSVEAGVHVRVWEFRVKQGREGEFEAAYGPHGDWARLFSAGEGYLGTELLRDRDVGGRYLTIDRWESAEAFASFCRDQGVGYAELDARCEQWTEAERDLGAWRPVET